MTLSTHAPLLPKNILQSFHEPNGLLKRVNSIGGKS